jgi:hypothetical protein
MSHVISMHCPDDPRQTAISDLSQVILCLVVPMFEHTTLIVHAKQHNHSAIAASFDLALVTSKTIPTVDFEQCRSERH